MTHSKPNSFHTLPILLALILLALTPQISIGAPKGSPPNGARVIQPGHIPAACTETDAPFSTTGATYGYYWSEKSKAWIAAPYCYARWGLMSASASQIITAGSTVTATVLYDDSRMAGYMGIFGGVNWQYPGTLVSGCGTRDVTCTVKIGDKKNPPKEWAWYEFHISGPGRVFILPPSYAPRCQPDTPCLDTATNAWTYVGVSPNCSGAARINGRRALAVCKIPKTISGRVVTSAGEPLSGFTVVASQGGRKKRDITGDDGSYSIEVKKGEYDLSVNDKSEWTIKKGVDCQVKPCSKHVKIDKKSARNVNFKSAPIPVVIAWTGPSDHVRTASGDFYDDNLLTASSPKIILGAVVRFKANGKSVVATINDRGPYEIVKRKVIPHRARQFSVTGAVMDALGLDRFETARVTAEVIK